MSTHRSRVLFWSYALTSYFKWPQAQVYFFQWFISNMLCLCHYGPPLSRFWFQTNLGRAYSASYLEIQAGKPVSHQGWSRSTSNFYALIGQNLTGEFMRKINAASWNLFPLTAEADRVLCQPVMVLTVFFYWMYKMKYSCYQESSVSLFIVFFFRLWDASLVKVGNAISDGVVFVFHLAWCVRGFKSVKRFWPYFITFRSCV